MLKKNLALAIVTTVVILLPIAAGLILWDNLPAEMPIHWDVKGNVDNHADKAFTVFAIPLIIAAVHWLCILATNADPRNKNTNGKIATLVLGICPIVSLMICSVSYATALGHSISIQTIVPLLLGILFIIIGNYMPKAQRNYTIGIKVPWTLNSDENWARTHRFAGIVWVIGGGIVVLMSFIGSVYVLLPFILTMAIIPIVYSYAYYARHEK